MRGHKAPAESAWRVGSFVEKRSSHHGTPAQAGLFSIRFPLAGGFTLGVRDAGGTIRFSEGDRKVVLYRPRRTRPAFLSCTGGLPRTISCFRVRRLGVPVLVRVPSSHSIQVLWTTGCSLAAVAHVQVHRPWLPPVPVSWS